MPNMKAVILAGGRGTRISEESQFRPKPMIEIGGQPILWHIMKIYSHYGINDFIVCCGYKSWMIKNYFLNYYAHASDITVDLSRNQVEIHKSTSEPWRVTLVDTGLDTQTGGRLKRVRHLLDGTFCLTYGDGLADIDIAELIEFHRVGQGLVTLTAVRPAARFGALELEGNTVSRFEEKPEGDGRWINGGFFVCQPEALDYIDDDSTIWERHPLEHIARDGKLQAYKHQGFWSAMDTLRDKNALESLWLKGDAPWKR